MRYLKKEFDDDIVRNGCFCRIHKALLRIKFSSELRVLLLAVKLSAKYISFWRCKAFPKRQILCYTLPNVNGERITQIKTENSLVWLAFNLYIKDELRLSVIRITASTHTESIALLQRVGAVKGK